MTSETVTLHGHLLDSNTLAAVLDEIAGAGASYELARLELGATHEEPSTARITVTAPSDKDLLQLLERLRQYGANADTVEDARFEPADLDGAFPTGFYSSTNLETEVRIEGRWIRVRYPEMDCGIVLDDGVPRTLPMAEVVRGTPVLMRGLGIRVLPLARPGGDAERQAFEFMSSDVSSEKPKPSWWNRWRTRCGACETRDDGSCGLQALRWCTPARAPTSAR